MKKLNYAFLFLSLGLFLWAIPQNALADASELVGLLASKLNISEDQAQAGSGILFNYAKEKLGDSKFGSVSNALSGIDGLMNSAPKDDGSGSSRSKLGGSSSLGGFASKLGDQGGSLAGLASLSGLFSKVGLKSEMVGKFVPIILSFMQSKGGDTVKNLLASVWK